MLWNSWARLPFGSIRPEGWLKTQMQKDLDSFIGHLDQLVPDLFKDPIYGAGRLHQKSLLKELGNLKEGDAEGEEQYQWWNSETQSNWWDGFLRHVLLLDDHGRRPRVEAYVRDILATQDADGYLGIYDTDLRYGFRSENGELWAKATLYRALLAYFESSGDENVWQALIRAVDNVMDNYPIDRSDPFQAGSGFSGGVAHGLTFTDVLHRMYELSGERKYLDYALFLYLNFSKNFSSEGDVQLPNILDPEYRLQSHGVHTYEHLRPLTVAAYAAAENTELQQALAIYLSRVESVSTLSGGPIGDEWIGGRTADPTHTGYEYCSIQELLDSYGLLLQKTGNPEYAERIERLFYNAAQGARHPERPCIAYLKTDNSFEMMGSRNGEQERGRQQTRYKYSPAHQDVAVCCSPNAGRIAPYFTQYAWLQRSENTLCAALLMPCSLQTAMQGVPIRIDIQTQYPFGRQFQLRVSTDRPLKFRLWIRRPVWAVKVKCSLPFREKEGYLQLEQEFYQTEIQLEFEAEPRLLADTGGKTCFAHGPLIYARPIEAEAVEGRSYAPGFEDWYYKPVQTDSYAFVPQHGARFENGELRAMLRNIRKNQIEEITLIPLGKTILRQMAF